MEYCKNLGFILILLLTQLNIDQYAQSNHEETNQNKCEENHVFDIMFINGYGLGYKIYSNSKSEIRLMLDFYGEGRFEDLEEIEKRYQNDELEEIKRNREENTEFNSINITAQYLYSFYESKLGKLYLGVGPMIGYNWNNHESEFKTNDYKSQYTTFRETYSFGINLLLGVRGELYKSISVFAEFQINTRWSWGDRETDNNYSYDNGDSENQESKSDINNLEYEIRYARIGIRFSI